MSCTFYFIVCLFALIGKHSINAEIQWNGNNWAFGCDFPGNDLTSVKIDGARCGSLCFKTPSCTHFTHTAANRGTCWMKSGNVTLSDAIAIDERSTVCGAIYAELNITMDTINWQQHNWAYGCDFIGNDFTSARTTGAQCGPLCSNRHGCTHFTWTKHNGGTCWMKKGSIAKSDAILTRDLSMVCGMTASQALASTTSKY